MSLGLKFSCVINISNFLRSYLSYVCHITTYGGI